MWLPRQAEGSKKRRLDSIIQSCVDTCVFPHYSLFYLFIFSLLFTLLLHFIIFSFLYFDSSSPNFILYKFDIISLIQSIFSHSYTSSFSLSYILTLLLSILFCINSISFLSFNPYSSHKKLWVLSLSLSLSLYFLVNFCSFL